MNIKNMIFASLWTDDIIDNLFEEPVRQIEKNVDEYLDAVKDIHPCADRTNYFFYNVVTRWK